MNVWRAAVGIQDAPPLRSFQILGAEKEYGSEVAAKEWCLKDFQRRLKNVLAGFEWREMEIGWRGGTPRLYYEVWRDRG